MEIKDTAMDIQNHVPEKEHNAPDALSRYQRLKIKERSNNKHELITGMAAAVNRDTEFDYTDAEDVAKACTLEEAVSVVSWERMRKNNKRSSNEQPGQSY